MYYDDIKLFFTEEKRDIFDCSYWYLSAENAIYWCLEHPNCQIFPVELVCHPLNATQIFTYCFHICGKYALRMAFSCKVGVPNFPLRTPTWGGGGGGGGGLTTRRTTKDFFPDFSKSTSFILEKMIIVYVQK